MTPDFTSDDEDFLAAFAELARQIKDLKTRFYRSIEKALVSQLEIIEGHMPSNEEIRQHASRFEDPNGTHIQISWKGVLIVDAQMEFDMDGSTATSHVKVLHKVDLTEEIAVDLD
jgi:hypothetical protein